MLYTVAIYHVLPVTIGFHRRRCQHGSLPQSLLATALLLSALYRVGKAAFLRVGLVPPYHENLRLFGDYRAPLIRLLTGRGLQHSVYPEQYIGVFFYCIPPGLKTPR